MRIWLGRGGKKIVLVVGAGSLCDEPDVPVPVRLSDLRKWVRCVLRLCELPLQARGCPRGHQGWGRGQDQWFCGEGR